MQYGLIGMPLGHSYSPALHRMMADYPFELCEVTPAQLDDLLKTKSFRAINVTLPYKQTVIPYLNEISPMAKRIGAVNTIVNKDGKLYGYNADFAGMKALAEHLGFDCRGKKVLILGSGGTSKTARAVFEDLGAAEIYRVSRSPKEGMISYEDAVTAHSDAAFLVNTTPVGMYPNTDGAAIDLDAFPDLEGVLDAVYHPIRTDLVLAAQRRGIAAAGGLYMLTGQAVYASALFRGIDADPSVIDTCYRNLLLDKRSIVLIGMPSSGKSSVGKLLAEKLGKKFIDTDALIVERAGMSIADMFEKQGEAAFRALEKEVIADVSKENGAVISTGGGVPMDADNVRRLKHDGVILFLDRPVEKLTASDDRPLARDHAAIEKLYETRYPVYCAAADHRIPVTGDERAAADAILEVLTK